MGEREIEREREGREKRVGKTWGREREGGGRDTHPVV